MGPWGPAGCPPTPSCAVCPQQAVPAAAARLATQGPLWAPLHSPDPRTVLSGACGVSQWPSLSLRPPTLRPGGDCPLPGPSEDHSSRGGHPVSGKGTKASGVRFAHRDPGAPSGDSSTCHPPARGCPPAASRSCSHCGPALLPRSLLSGCRRQVRCVQATLSPEKQPRQSKASQT